MDFIQENSRSNGYVTYCTATRHIVDLGIGTDNLLRRQEPSHIKLWFTISNLTNKVALYNFHSTFSGTHFVAPRTYSGAVGLVF
jgi:hypothetical protein